MVCQGHKFAITRQRNEGTSRDPKYWDAIGSKDIAMLTFAAFDFMVLCLRETAKLTVAGLGMEVVDFLEERGRTGNDSGFTFSREEVNQFPRGRNDSKEKATSYGVCFVELRSNGGKNDPV